MCVGVRFHHQSIEPCSGCLPGPAVWNYLLIAFGCRNYSLHGCLNRNPNSAVTCAQLGDWKRLKRRETNIFFKGSGVWVCDTLNGEVPRLFPLFHSCRRRTWETKQLTVVVFPWLLEATGLGYVDGATLFSEQFCVAFPFSSRSNVSCWTALARLLRCGETRSHSYERQQSRFPRVTWGAQGKASCFCSYNTMPTSNGYNCVFLYTIGSLMSLYRYCSKTPLYNARPIVLHVASG